MTTSTHPPAPGVVEDEWLAATPRRSRLRWTLLVLLAAALVFLAGVEVQKQYGAAPGTTAAAPGRASGFTPPSGGAFAGGPSAGAVPTSSASPTTGAAVIGTVVSIKGGVWTVKDLGGHLHTVTVGSSVPISQDKQVSAAAVGQGATVDISGSTAADGRVTATTITLR